MLQGVFVMIYLALKVSCWSDKVSPYVGNFLLLRYSGFCYCCAIQLGLCQRLHCDEQWKVFQCLDHAWAATVFLFWLSVSEGMICGL